MYSGILNRYSHAVVTYSSTGNYTIAQLPVGTYEVSVAVPGFKRFVRSGITVQVAATLRIDIQLEVGAATESVTVQADAPLLKTESGELSHNVTTATVNSLPILGIGSSLAGSSAIRNPQAVAYLLPGAYVAPNAQMRVNGDLAARHGGGALPLLGNSRKTGAPRALTLAAAAGARERPCFSRVPARGR
jgi:hypothetical protein